MPSKHAKVWKALKDHLEAYPDIPPVKYGGQSFDPPSTGGVADPYFIVDDVRLEGRRIFQDTDTKNWHSGNLAVGVMCPLWWDDLQTAEYAGRLADYFSQDTTMTYSDVTVKVAKQPTVSTAGYRDGDMFRLPVLVEWEGFV